MLFGAGEKTKSFVDKLSINDDSVTGMIAQESALVVLKETYTVFFDRASGFFFSKGPLKIIAQNRKSKAAMQAVITFGLAKGVEGLCDLLIEYHQGKSESIDDLPDEVYQLKVLQRALVSKTAEYSVHGLDFKGMLEGIFPEGKIPEVVAKAGEELRQMDKQTDGSITNKPKKNKRHKNGR